MIVEKRVGLNLAHPFFKFDLTEVACESGPMSIEMIVDSRVIWRGRLPTLPLLYYF